MRTIANDQLVRARIPARGAPWSEIIRFAHTFDGYEAYGSFDACADVANRGNPQTLTELRACLFFEARRWRHFGEDPDADAMAYIYALLAEIRVKVP